MIKIVQEKEAKFITHAGSFHADEVMATALLEILYDEILLARVGEVEEAKEDAFIYDVGLGNYDHHQEDKVRRENGIAYSSVGLIWRDYG
ncbi:MAG TPA: metal-dependent hydrolase, partial [Erysipelotrichaceae bacterium]|nr:metal-dependent hydrolase [Erysipelotrichaceae bacterium]